LPHLHWEKVMYHSSGYEAIVELGDSRLSTASPGGVDNIDLYLYLGQLLLQNGASTQRVMDSIKVLHASLGGGEIQVVVDLDALIITSVDACGGCTRVARTKAPMKVDSVVLTEISRLLHRLPEEKLSPEQVRERLGKIADRVPLYSTWICAVMVSIAMAAFGLLNRGDLASAVIVFPATLAAFFLRHLLVRKSFNPYVVVLATAALGGLVVCLVARVEATITPDIALAAAVIFLIPGVQLINGGMEVLRNHVQVGMARLTSVIVTLAVIAFGLGVALALLPLPNSNASFDWPGWPTNILWDALLGAVAAAGFAALFNTSFYPLVACALCGAMGRGARVVLLNYGVEIALATLVSTVAITLIAIYFARRWVLPEIAISVTAALTMIPGYFAIKFMNGLFSIASHGADISREAFLFTAQAGLNGVLISAALVAGIIFPIMILMRDKPRY